MESAQYFPGPLYQNEVKCSALDMEIIFHSHEDKNHFHKKLRLCTWPHFESGDFSRDKLLLACEQQTHFRSSLLSLRKVPEMRLRFAG